MGHSLDNNNNSNNNNNNNNDNSNDSDSGDMSHAIHVMTQSGMYENLNVLAFKNVTKSMRCIGNRFSMFSCRVRREGSPDVTFSTKDTKTFFFIQKEMKFPSRLES